MIPNLVWDCFILIHGLHRKALFQFQFYLSNFKDQYLKKAFNLQKNFKNKNKIELFYINVCRKRPKTF